MINIVIIIKISKAIITNNNNNAMGNKSDNIEL